MSLAKKHWESILAKEAFGFSLLIAISWLTEAFDLPHILYKEAPAFNWHRALLRTAVIAAIWLWVHLETTRLLKRLHRLEEFLLICSWCRKVGDHGKWLTLEEYFDTKFATGTSHGICPDCAKTAMGPTTRSRSTRPGLAPGQAPR
jgi:hypothetical protein